MTTGLVVDPVNGILFGERLFADVTARNLEMVSSWVIQMGPKSKDKCPPERHREERHMEKKRKALGRWRERLE